MSASAPTAFISYSREDSAFVLRLAEDLRAGGARIWLDQLDIVPGHAWDNAIEQALMEATRMLLVLSPSSVKSDHVRNEISLALQEKKIVVPVLYRDCAIPLQLHRIQWIDFRTDYAGGLNTLLTHLGIQALEPDATPVEATALATPDAPAETSRQSVQTDLQQLTRSQNQSALPLEQDDRQRRDPEPPKSGQPQKTPPRKVFYYAMAGVVLLIAFAGAFFPRRSSPIIPPNSKEWEQLTFFTDSAVYPELSPDGRMIAFIRGNDSFQGHGQVYVKLLPGGEPVQLTHDAAVKLAPAFSPDGSSIVYSAVEPWDTWEVPVLGGDPHLFLPNSSSLTWSDQGKRLLFSEVRGVGIHLVVVTTDEGRGNSRDVYVPPGERGMAHHSYRSPDGKWVLIVEMDSQGKILPCRVVPFPSPNVPPANEVKLVGPPARTCLAGAWSPDGRWIYLTANEDAGAVGRAGWRLPPSSHIWRQSFPDGQPEQVTFGPTSQEGIAMASDGKSIVTSVGSLDRTVWMHDQDGDHQISSEGNASSPSFSADGSKLYFLMANGQTRGEELWVKDLSSGKVERVLPGNSMQDYSVSRDGKEVAFTKTDQSGRSNLWVAPAGRRSSPVRISSAVAEDSPFFLPGGDLVFRAVEGGSNFLYRMKIDGSVRQKITPERILDINGVSPDGRWVVVGTPGSEEEHTTSGMVAFAVDGTSAVKVSDAYCLLTWDTRGKFVYLNFPDQRASGDSYALPAMRDSGLPKLPPTPAERIEDFANPKTTIPWPVESAVSPTVYTYTRENTRRNLYRIQLP
jgi:eukaryotic-like serine/threonine-protein kinase